MNGIIYFFGSGAAFFAGVALQFVAVASFAVCGRTWPRRAATVCVLVGLALVILSAVPLPYWYYGVALTMALLWLVSERSEARALQSRRAALRVCVCVLWVAALVAEVPYHFAPTFNVKVSPTLHIFADSVTAGMGEGSVETWPRLLARHHAINVQDHSQMGARARTMLRKAQEVAVGHGLILLEIGGNDLLGSTSATEFEHDLDKLLATLSGAGRLLVMFELPLPPLTNEFGRIQRRLASKHQVTLIPKRMFVGVLTSSQATVDSVHLSPRGHRLMADAVWGLIQPAFGAGH